MPFTKKIKKIFFDRTRNLLLTYIFYRMGYPIVLVVGSKSCQEVPKIEVHICGKSMELDLNASILEISKYMREAKNKYNSSII